MSAATKRKPAATRRRVKNPAELVLLSANPAELVLMGANPDDDSQSGRRGLRGASEMYEDFHGEAGEHVDTYHEPEPRPQTLAQLGDLIELQVKRGGGWKWGILDLSGRGIKLAANPQGSQIYFVGGNQKISKGELTQLNADNSKDLLDLGECMTIAYRARKAHVNGIASDYEHHFGDETGRRPRLMYDKRAKEPRLFLAGGEYIAKIEGIRN